VAVVHEVADFRERDAHVDRIHLACSGTPRCHGAIASGAAVQHRHVVHQRVGRSGSGACRKNLELGLVDMEIMVLAGHVHQFPQFIRGVVAWRQRQAYADKRVIERRDILESSGNGFSLRIRFFVADAEPVGIVVRHAEEDATAVSGL